MNGAQDLGGMMGFGPVVPEPVKPLFHAKWEPRAFALTLAMGATGEWTIDMARFARESLPPPVYLTSSYYQIWLAGLERLLEERGLVTDEEIAAGRSLVDSRPVKRVLAADKVAETLARGGPTERDAATPARFKPGDRVRAKTMNPTGHTRIPRYCRGHVGTVEAIHGVHVFPDTSAAGAGENPAWLYGVAFDGREIWGEDSAQDVSLRIDLWEPYLDPA
ncbi:nitrile hydratase subunit beta [Stappia stellulata]|uniref:nitrile hydratase subunit beta n=1 Tax=Stappia stellulata TaxID=71235 RepID=UPI001CD4D219|nr:nitrile hydratase subunit beta [Stappia stellulata]MCA1243643.1 nitrile hydratase subunit beta [Stappia stellulata]